MLLRYSRLNGVTGRSTVAHAAETIGANKSTVYRWIEKGLLTQDENGLVDIDEAYAIKSAQHLGRKCGNAHPDYEPDPSKNIDKLLDRALGIIASVWESAQPHHRNWVMREITNLDREEHQTKRGAKPIEEVQRETTSRSVPGSNSKHVSKTRPRPRSKSVRKTQPLRYVQRDLFDSK